MDPVEQLITNVWIAPYYEDDLSEAGLNIIGVEKILFGSDWPHGEGLESPIDYAKELTAFSDSDVRKIMRDNALICWASGDGLTMAQWTIGEVLDAIAEVIPDRPMTVCGERVSTYAESADRTRRLANFLPRKVSGAHRERGELQNWECGQDRVALIMHNDLYPDMVIGCLKARTVPVNVNYHRTPREVAELPTTSDRPR